MTSERIDHSAGASPKAAKPARFLGSLKDALLAAGREELPAAAIPDVAPAPVAAKSEGKDIIALPPPAETPRAAVPCPEPRVLPLASPGPSAQEAARLSRTVPIAPGTFKAQERHVEFAAPPTTRVVRRREEDEVARTRLVRGKQSIARGEFLSDPVVGFLIVVGGPGLGAHRAIFEGNNTVGRTGSNRIALDFGDEAISAEAQAYIRYDSADRSFLFVPNLAKTNVVSVNDKRPAGPVELKSMDVITLGRTQVAFLPFCGSEFDWSEISEAKD